MPPPGLVLEIAAGLVGVVALLWAACRWPHAALWASFPVLLWPATPDPAQAGIVALLAATALLRGMAGHARGVGGPTLLFAGFASVMAFGLVVHGMPLVVVSSVVQNTFLVLLISVGLVPIVATLRPPLVPTMRALFLSGLVASTYTLLSAEDFDGRASLENFNPDAVGLSATAATLLGVGLFVLERRALWLVLASVPAALMLSAQARSTLVVLGVGLTLMWLLRRSRPVRLVGCLALATAMPFLGALAGLVQRTLFTTRDPLTYETESRVEVLRLAGKLVVENPLLGIGWRHFTDESLQRLGFIIEPHNDFARIAVEGGLIAFVLFAALLSRLVTFRAPGGQDTILRSIALAIAAGLLFSNTITDLRVVLPLWVLVGIAWRPEWSRSASLSAAPEPGPDEAYRPVVSTAPRP